MQLGILVTGHVDPDLAERHGDFAKMYRSLFVRGDDLAARHYTVIDGELPDSPTECDAWLITGSRHGVYDDLPWIPRLMEFLRQARAQGVPLVGICFGHQIMAAAFGGKAVKSDRGWGLGVHEYEVHHRPAWMADAPEHFAMHAIHQDQVIEIPDDATCLASSPFCRYAMLSYGPVDAPDAISIQPHPEYDAGFMRDLLASRIGSVIPEDVGAPAVATLGKPVTSTDFARWALAAIGRRVRPNVGATGAK